MNEEIDTLQKDSSHLATISTLVEVRMCRNGSSGIILFEKQSLDIDDVSLLETFSVMRNTDTNDSCGSMLIAKILSLERL